MRSGGSASPDEADEEAEVGQALEGPVSADAYARLALPLLVAHVRVQTDSVLAPLTYRGLAAQLGRRNKHGEPWARGLGHVLERVTALTLRVLPSRHSGCANQLRASRVLAQHWLIGQQPPSGMQRGRSSGALFATVRATPP